MKDPVFILGAHKSGSSLLRNLLDGHPELFAVPLETHVFQAAGFWVDYRLRKSRPPLHPLEKAAEAFLEIVRHYNSPRVGPYGDSRPEGVFDVEVLNSYLERNVASFDELVQLYFRGIFAAIHHKALPEHLRVVEKSVEHAEFALDLQQMFPRAQFLRIMRNPYANLVSLRLVAAKRRKQAFPFLGRALAGLYNSYYHLYRNRRLLPASQYMIVRYEDLLRTPEDVMNRISEFLGIGFQDSLLEPSVMGQPWSGNSSRGRTFAGIASDNVRAWFDQITNLEIHCVNQYFSHVLDDFGYEVLRPKRSRYWPALFETPTVYLANRLLPYYL